MKRSKVGGENTAPDQDVRGGARASYDLTWNT